MTCDTFFKSLDTEYDHSDACENKRKTEAFARELEDRMRRAERERDEVTAELNKITMAIGDHWTRMVEMIERHQKR